MPLGAMSVGRGILFDKVKIIGKSRGEYRGSKGILNHNLR